MDTEEQKPLSLKPVNLLDAQPGRADAPGIGEQIAIITVEFQGEIERPLMLNMRDTKKLAITLFAILEHHGNEKAKKVMAFFNKLNEREGD